MSRWWLLAVIAPALAWGSEPYSTDTFTPGSVPPDVRLEGHIRIAATGLETREHVRFPFIPPIPGKIPAIDVDLVQSGQDLLPVRRGLVTTNDPIFDYFVSPGRVWLADGRAHASLPITLMNRFGNCAHNGLVAFTYTASSIGDVKVLVDQETCHFLKFDLWGAGTAEYVPGVAPNADRVRADFVDEEKHRIPSGTLGAFAAKYHVDLDALLGGLPKNDDLTTAGIYIDGVRYDNGCSTRGGPYPYCDRMLHTSWSTAKSAFPALVLMALAQRYGRDIYNEKIVDYVPEAKAAQGDWNVTFNQIGDMTSGNFTNGDPVADAQPGNFYSALTRADKLAAALSSPRGAPAGSRFVYQTADTFILVNALDRWLAQHDTGFADSYEYLASTVLKPLHVSPEVLSTARTHENGAFNNGTAFGGMGMWWTGDAFVKVARLMSIDGGKIDGTQVLEPHVLAATLQRDPKDRGVETHFFGNYYNNGMWASPMAALGVRFACNPWVPFMTGVSGVRATLMPNDVIFYYFDDAQAYPLIEAVKAVDQVRPLCS